MASRLSNHLTRAVAAVCAIGFSSTVHAMDQFTGTLTANAASGQSETAVVAKVGNSAQNVVNLLMGPGMWIVMGVGAVIALFGLAQNQKATLFTGIGIFVFAGILRALFNIMA